MVDTHTCDQLSNSTHVLTRQRRDSEAVAQHARLDISRLYSNDSIQPRMRNRIVPMEEVGLLGLLCIQCHCLRCQPLRRPGDRSISQWTHRYSHILRSVTDWEREQGLATTRLARAEQSV